MNYSELIYHKSTINLMKSPFFVDSLGAFLHLRIHLRPGCFAIEPRSHWRRPHWERAGTSHGALGFAGARSGVALVEGVIFYAPIVKKRVDLYGFVDLEHHPTLVVND